MASNKRSTAVTRREDLAVQEQRQTQHQPRVQNALKIKIDHLRSLEPLTDNQSKFFDIYNSGGYFIFLLGQPGTGKTYVSMGKALEEVLQKDNPYKELVVIRSTVQSRDVGYLPGDLAQKSELFELPYKEICTNLFGRNDAWDRLKEQHLARFITTTAIRGISLDNAIIIVDEIQNFQWGELSTVIQRVGAHSKVVLCGDKFQDDLVKSKNDVSGLSKFLSVARTMDAFSEVIFTPDDIVRSQLVRDFILACELKGYMPSN